MPSSEIKEAIAQSSKAMFLLGVLIMVVGVGAFLAPLMALATVATILAWIYLLAGTIRIVHAYQSRKQRGFGLRLAIGILYLVVSLLIFAPIIGDGETVPLSFALGLALMAEGSLECILAVQMRPNPQWLWVLLSGGLSVTLGVLVFSGLGVGAVWLLGALVGSSLVLTGFWFIMLSQAFGNKTD